MVDYNAYFALSLLSHKGIGRSRAKSLLQESKYNMLAIDDLCAFLEEQIGKILPSSMQISRDSVSEAMEIAESIIENSTNNGIKTVVPCEFLFPKRLKEIKDAPIILFYKGNISSLDSSTIAIIGTREPSEYGIKCGARFGEFFAENNVTVVSGLATGCDSLAHRGALTKKGKTIAFLAHGLERIYPAANTNLASDIIDADGGLISEYPIGTQPMRNYFVERDRLQSGSSKAVLIIETDEKGGTMHTASFCLEQHRLLYCLSHPEKYAKHDKARGNQKLVREGKAKPIVDKNDLHDLLKTITSEDTSENTEASQNQENTNKESISINPNRKKEQLSLFNGEEE